MLTDKARFVYMKKNELFFVYILSCSDGSLYTGITKNIENRIEQHNGIKKGGAKYTRSKRPVKLVYKKEFKTKSLAQKEEIRIKKMKRKEKMTLIFLK